MNIMNFIMWFIIYGNSLFAQGYTYDVTTSQFIPPAKQIQILHDEKKDYDVNYPSRQVRGK